MSLTDAEMFERMRKGWRAGKPETVCGNGSLRMHTAAIRAWLPEIVERYGIRRVCDAGAGDMHWMSGMFWPIDDYRPFDLIAWKPEVTQLDITRDRLPDCDAVICRYVLNHLVDDVERINRAIGLFRQAARYLIATQFTGENLRQASPQFARLDLRRAPYNLGEPLEAVRDGPERECTLALWKLQPC